MYASCKIAACRQQLRPSRAVAGPPVKVWTNLDCY